MKNALRHVATLLKYHGNLLTRRLCVPFLPSSSYKDLRSLPEVTIFISSFNTRYPLELTIKSLLKNTTYPNFKIWIADNASNDGSIEYLDSLMFQNIPIRVIKSDKPRPHSEWLDEVAKTVDTPYWMSVHSDMIFYSGDWIVDMLKIMENNLDQDLLIAERVSTGEVQIEPLSGKKVRSYEKFCTWLFCFRSNYRDRIQTSFDFVKEPEDLDTGIIPIYDTGERLLADMKECGMRHGYMPSWFQKRYYHFGSLSYAFDVVSNKNYRDFKSYQMKSIRQMIGKLE